MLLHFYTLAFLPSIKLIQVSVLSAVCVHATHRYMLRFFCVVFCLCFLLVGKGMMRSHPSPANSHQSGPMLEPLREEAIAHSTGAHSPSTQGGHGHLTHQGPVYFSFQSYTNVHVCVFCN